MENAEKMLEMLYGLDYSKKNSKSMKRVKEIIDKYPDHHMPTYIDGWIK